jgi:hypothetical protein
MGRPIGDGSKVDPKYQDVEVWLVRRHHVIGFTHGKIPLPGDPRHTSCAFFSDTHAFSFRPRNRSRIGSR